MPNAIIKIPEKQENTQTLNKRHQQTPGFRGIYTGKTEPAG